MNSRSTPVLAVVGLIAVTVLGCTTALIITGHISAESWPSIIAGVVSPIVLTILGVQNSQQSQTLDYVVTKVDKVGEQVNGRMSELISRVPSTDGTPKEGTIPDGGTHG